AGPVDGSADAWLGRRARGRRRAHHEGPLPDVGSRLAGRHELVVRERNGGAVHAEALRQFPRRRQLHAIAEMTLADEALEMRLDLARERHRLLAVERDVQGCHDVPFSWISKPSQGPIGMVRLPGQSAALRLCYCYGSHPATAKIEDLEPTHDAWEERDERSRRSPDQASGEMDRRPARGSSRRRP